MYYFGLGLSFIANILFLISILQKNKSKLFKFQTMETLVNIFKNICLGGYTGATTQIIGLIRNILLSKNITSIKIPILLSIGQIILGYFVNNHGLIGYLPIFASIIYTMVSFTTKNIIYTKLALIINLAMWLIYGITIKDWISVVTGLLFIIITIISLINYKKDVQRL